MLLRVSISNSIINILFSVPIYKLKYYNNTDHSRKLKSYALIVRCRLQLRSKRLALRNKTQSRRLQVSPNWMIQKNRAATCSRLKMIYSRRWCTNLKGARTSLHSGCAYHIVSSLHRKMFVGGISWQTSRG